MGSKSTTRVSQEVHKAINGGPVWSKVVQGQIWSKGYNLAKSLKLKNGYRAHKKSYETLKGPIGILRWVKGKKEP